MHQRRQREPSLLNRSEEALSLFRLLGAPGIGAVRLSGIIEWSRGNGVPLSNLMESRRLQSEVLTQKQMHALQANLESDLGTWDSLREARVHVLTPTDKYYPMHLAKRLEGKAPPLLFALGNLDVLEMPSVGFCGSRRASEKGLMVARDCAEQLGQLGLNTVSGYAAGVDLSVHEAALNAGATTTIVLAEGILKHRTKQVLKQSWDWDRIVVVSEFLPGIPWSVHSAMQRNQTICALSDAMVLIEARTSGGSMAAGRTCLGLRIPLFAAVYDGMPESADGNRELLQVGAHSLLKSSRTGRANVRPILSAIRQSDSRLGEEQVDAISKRCDQLSVFD